MDKWWTSKMIALIKKDIPTSKLLKELTERKIKIKIQECHPYQSASNWVQKGFTLGNG